MPPPPLKLFSAYRSDVFQHGPHPSSLIWKPQVSERPSHPPKKRAPKLGERVLKLSGEGSAQAKPGSKKPP